MKLDIHSAVQTAAILALIGTLLAMWLGVQSIRAGNRLPFFRKRRDRVMRGWRLIFSSVVLVGVYFAINQYAEPVVYHYYPPSPTVTTTPTITVTPTITLTPTITETPTITPTSSVTVPPELPAEVATQFISQVTPNPDTGISALTFAQELDEDSLLPIDPAIEFENPVGHLYAAFSYDGMMSGSQWTALWFRGTEMVYYETLPWDGSTGGYGYSDWDPESGQWVPGEYGVHIYVGTEWKVSGYFTIAGEPPEATSTATATGTPRPSATARPSATPRSTATPKSTPTRTVPPTATLTPTITLTPTASHTPWPTITPRPTDTHQPTPTKTATPTATATRRR